MQIDIDYGREHLAVEVRAEQLVPVWRETTPEALADPAAAVRAAVETPHGFPALRLALTPDDHVTVVLDEALPNPAALVTPVLEHIAQAHVAPEAITLLCLPPSSGQPWVEELPDAFQEVRVEVHDPTDRRRLSYLASTRQGRRLYLNRSVVDADQVVVLARRRFDPLLGYGGAEGAIYPALSDEATLRELSGRLTLDVPGATPWPVRREAAEAAWLLGTPFFVQVIEGAGDDVSHVVAGTAESILEGQRLLDARWRLRVERPADLVIASVTSPEPHFHDLARALSNAARVVRPGGKIVLLSRGTPKLNAGGELLRQSETPQQALAELRRGPHPDPTAVFEWASAAEQATIFLLSGLEDESAEELFAVPLEHARQVQRLLDGGGSCLFIADAHKTLAVVEDGVG